jgi:two-component system response regulator DctR
MPQLTVAMVEDDPIILRINRTFLQEIPGYQLLWEATTVAEAWKKLQQQLPDLLLLDIYLPDRSGLSLLELLQKNDKNLPTILITAASETQTVINALKLGVYDYLIKPYLKKRFIQALNDFYLTYGACGHYTQAEVDQLVNKRKEQQEFPEIPKGLNEGTLGEIVKRIREASDGLTTEELAKGMGVAVVSVRRYLHFLVNTGKVTYQPVYGQQGRPFHRYFNSTLKK